ncbi:hypothetical protein CLV84_2647 [Neolewinella xylanilytica]|uniref:Uncharacterized protein n=1 Tax=Neolewinella xylanilytica TaxID=1514080 RepID=A0A2S6I3K4_9BACT|nr:hypothetical protein [Neolewinella xylanilytica]PPK85743.1 hypothetical protein CLV84_2647 [Neolewinella xylanilytica]
MRIPYFVSFYSGMILVLAGLATQDSSVEGMGWPTLFMSLAMLAIALGVIDVIAAHKRGV